VSNFVKRLILTLVSVPIMIFSLFWPQNNHFILIAFVGIIITFLGSIEFMGLIEKKGIKTIKYLVPFTNLLLYVFAYFYANNLFGITSFKPLLPLFLMFLIGIISFIFAIDILKKDFSKSFEKIASLILGIVYVGIPSFFVPFILNISFPGKPEDPVPLFFGIESHGTLTGSLMGFLIVVIVFGNDIFSYVFGYAFGRNNVINLEVSPKKSWAGYIGGFFSTFFWVTAYYLLFKEVFNFDMFSVWFYYSMAFLGALVVPVGDLVESVFKRSAEVKDSGTLMLGRGGILDSADSALYFLPIFFCTAQIYLSFLQ
jgi:phosphatidate cytidylyltransferase